MSNPILDKAKINKNDEFFTLLKDIEKELDNYKEFFYNKIVYCNCDTINSNFYKYFIKNKEKLNLKEILISEKDFREPQNIEKLKQSDIVVTNPPFSLFREYIELLIKYEKKFLIVGSKNAISYNDFFPYLKENKIWLGVNDIKEFLTPENEIKKFGNICWYTNLKNNRNQKPIPLKKQYSPEIYPTYDNYDAINVDRVADIPYDFDGIMGVPITFMDKYCPNQFEIIGLGKKPHFTPLKKYEDCIAINNGKIKKSASLNNILIYKTKEKPKKGTYYKVNGEEGYFKAPYTRILIRRKK